MVCAERAKTGRSCCRVCGTPIAQGEVRLGRPEKKRGADIIGWSHVRCCEAAALPACAEEWAALDGWDALDEAARRSVLGGAAPDADATTVTG